MNRCVHCGSEMIALFSSWACKAECDLRPSEIERGSRPISLALEVRPVDFDQWRGCCFDGSVLIWQHLYRPELYVDRPGTYPLDWQCIGAVIGLNHNNRTLLVKPAST